MEYGQHIQSIKQTSVSTTLKMTKVLFVFPKSQPYPFIDIIITAFEGSFVILLLERSNETILEGSIKDEKIFSESVMFLELKFTDDIFSNFNLIKYL